LLFTPKGIFEWALDQRLLSLALHPSQQLVEVATKVLNNWLKEGEVVENTTYYMAHFEATFME
jgi:hypothetical protein